MKQHITLAQWNELSNKLKRYFSNKMLESDMARETGGCLRCYEYMNIGNMIELLGDQWYFSLFTMDNGKFTIDIISAMTNEDLKKYEFLDMLFEAVKIKYNKII